MNVSPSSGIFFKELDLQMFIKVDERPFTGVLTVENFPKAFYRWMALQKKDDFSYKHERPFREIYGCWQLHWGKGFQRPLFKKKKKYLQKAFHKCKAQ